MSNFVPNNMSSVFTNSSDLLEFEFFQQLDLEIFPDFLSPTNIEAVSSPPFDSSYTSIDLYPRVS